MILDDLKGWISLKEQQLVFISDPVIKRVFRILDYIEIETRFTIDELSKMNNVTSRTTIKDIKFLKEHFLDSIELVYGNYGYNFEEKNSIIYAQKKIELLQNEVLFYLVGKIFYGETDSINELSYKHGFSETAFRRLLRKCEPVLSSYGLKWKLHPLDIEGDEASLRKFFKDFYYEGYKTPFMLFPDQDMRNLFLGKVDRLEVGTGTTPTAFYYTVFISIQRFLREKSISIPNSFLKKIAQEKDFILLCTLLKSTKELYNVKLSNEECAWIYLITVSKRTLEEVNQEHEFYQRFNEWPEIDKITNLYLNKQKTTLNIKNSIKIFLQTFFLSRKIQDLLSPILNKVNIKIMNVAKNIYGEEYRKNLNFINESNVSLGLSPDYLEDISASLTVLSLILVDMYKPSVNIGFLFEGDHFVVQMLQNQVKKIFSMHNVIFLPIQNLSRDKLSDKSIDLYVTNYEEYIPNYIKNLNYVLIKSLPDERDWKRVIGELNSFQANLIGKSKDIQQL